MSEGQQRQHRSSTGTRSHKKLQVMKPNEGAMGTEVWTRQSTGGSKKQAEEDISLGQEIASLAATRGVWKQ